MSFTELKHQKQAVTILQRSLRSGRLAHAYLLVGPRGAGKEALARTLAKALNCVGTKSKGAAHYPEDSCDKCRACQQIESETHPDVHWVRPESKSRRILIEKIRALEKAVYLKPREGRVKVGVIVDADRMVAQAANAFLKTLEEPPANSVLLLLTTDPQRLLTTIVSRCLPVRLAAGAGDRISKLQERVLTLLAAEPQAPRDGKTSPVAARYRTLAELNALLHSLREEKEKEVNAAWDTAQWDSYDKKIREQLEEELKAAVEAEYLSAREETLATLLAWHRDVLVMVEGADAKILMFPGHKEALNRRAAGLDYAKAAANLAAIERIRQHLDQNISESLALEVGLLQLNG